MAMPAYALAMHGIVHLRLCDLNCTRPVRLAVSPHGGTKLRRTIVSASARETRQLVAWLAPFSGYVSAGCGECALAGLTPVSSRLISVPRVGESPVSFECRLTQLIQLETIGGGAVQTWLTLGQVVGVHISNSLLNGGVHDTAAARPILRGGGAGDLFRDRTRRSVPDDTTTIATSSSVKRVLSNAIPDRAPAQLV
jgi:hypothetical protein